MVDIETIIIKETGNTFSQARTFILTPYIRKYQSPKNQKSKGSTATTKEASLKKTRKAISSINSSNLNDLQTNQELKRVKPLSEETNRKQISKLEDKLLRKKLPSSPFSRFNALDDSILDDTLIESPLDDIEQQKANWYRELMRHLNGLIAYKLIKPEGSSRSETGVIEIELDTQGNLKGAWVHLPSGNQQLDTSILHAVRSVKNYPIPKSEILNRYFRKMKYHYNGS